MKYSLSNTINQPLDIVVEKIKDADGVKNWMEGLQKIERISGVPGEVGAKSKFHFLHKKKEMEITETILAQNLPDSIKFAYESQMGYNDVELQFERLTDDSTKQTSISYFELKGFMKIISPVLKGMFKKQSLSYMDAFKRYVEGSE